MLWLIYVIGQKLNETYTHVVAEIEWVLWFQG